MKYLIPIFVLVFLILPTVVRAQDSITKLERLLDYIATVLFVIGAGIALIVVIISGIMYLTAGGNAEKVTTARKTLTYGLIGAAILLASGFILGLLEDILHEAGVV